MAGYSRPVFGSMNMAFQGDNTVSKQSWDFFENSHFFHLPALRQIAKNSSTKPLIIGFSDAITCRLKQVAARVATAVMCSLKIRVVKSKRVKIFKSRFQAKFRIQINRTLNIYRS
jgi:hypothetical protein